MSIQNSIASGSHGGVGLHCQTDRQNGSASGAVLAVRPEYVRFDQTKNVENSLPVTVTEVVYNGSCLSISAVSPEGKTVLVDVPDSGLAPQPGESGFVSWQSSDGFLLPEI